jgi:hypothetical protein
MGITHLARVHFEHVRALLAELQELDEVLSADAGLERPRKLARPAPIIGGVMTKPIRYRKW